MIFQKFFSFKPLGNMEENLYSWLLFLHSSLPPPPHGSFLSVLMWITKGEIISLKLWVHFNASTLFSVFWEHCGLLWVFSFLNSCRFVVTDSCQNPSQTLGSWFTCPCMIFFSWMWAGPSEFFSNEQRRWDITSTMLWKGVRTFFPAVLLPGSWWYVESCSIKRHMCKGDNIFDGHQWRCNNS